MGFLDLVFKSAVRKAVDSVVDKAVDSAFNGADSNTPVWQNGNVQPMQLERPDISGDITTQSGFVSLSSGDCRNISYIFEKADCLYESDNGAMEIDFVYSCANAQDDVYDNDLDLPQVYIGNDEFGVGSHFMQVNKINAVRTPVINHPNIFERVEFDHSYTYGGITNSQHYIAYRFYPVPEDRREDNCCELVLQFPTNCNNELRIKAIKAFALVAATLRIELK